MMNFNGWIGTTRAAVLGLARSLWLRLKEKGLRFLCVALVANGTGLSCSYLLYTKLTPALSILVVSILSGIIHVFITYSSHYCVTFKKPGHFLRGLWKVYLTAWLGMLITSILGQFLLGTLKLPFFVAQGIIFCMGAAYAVVMNFLVIFRERPPVSASASAPEPSSSSH